MKSNYRQEGKDEVQELMDNYRELNRYQFPSYLTYIMPIPPPLPLPTRWKKITRENRPETWRREDFVQPLLQMA